jgi:glycosyltransferase involved in cell wall biosynthesis
MIKKILIITDDFIHNSEKSGAILIKDLADAINATNNFSSIVIAPDISSSKIYKLELNGVETILFPSGKIKNTNFALRAYNEWLLSFRIKKCYKHIKSEEIYGIIYYSPSIFFGSAVKYFKKKFNCSSYLILRDLFPQWTVDLGVIKKNSFAHLFFKYFEKINYLHANKIGVMSESNLKIFSTRSDFKKFEVLPSWQKPVKIDNKKDSLNDYCLEHLRDKFVFFYGGNIGLAQGIETLLNLSKSLLHKKNIHFVFIGQGDAINLLKEKSLTNVTFLDSIKPEAYYELAFNFDVGLVSLHPNHTAHNYPGKIWGYMSLFKPIIGIVNNGNDVKKMINDNRAGLVCYHNEGIDKLTLHCIKLSNDLALVKEQGVNSHNIILEFTPEKTANQIFSFLSNLNNI